MQINIISIDGPPTYDSSYNQHILRLSKNWETYCTMSALEHWYLNLSGNGSIIIACSFVVKMSQKRRCTIIYTNQMIPLLHLSV